MRWGFIAGLSAATGLMVAFTAANAVALTARDLVGTWTPVSNPPYGDNPKGIAMFDAHGHVAIQLFRAAVPKYASNFRTQGTPDEYKATVEGSIAYFGTYKVKGTDLLVHIESSTFPNWNGADQRRTNLTIKGDKLTWTQATPSGGGGAVATVWKRLK
jgi:hypothetical protein